jgi:hypothetical protein
MYLNIQFSLILIQFDIINSKHNSTLINKKKKTLYIYVCVK